MHIGNDIGSYFGHQYINQLIIDGLYRCIEGNMFIFNVLSIFPVNTLNSIGKKQTERIRLINTS